jgi:septum formation protein
VSAVSTLWLASRSPRRAELLAAAGFRAQVAPADIDDGALRHGEVPPEWWVMSLAYLKARRVADGLRANNGSHDGVVLGADTVCAVGRAVMGQPRDAADARRMLRLMRRREHRTLTGVCLLPLQRPDWRLIVFDAAIVRLGDISDAQIDHYVGGEQWRGKAGAYNLSERMAAGWPISCLGDPATVMGLPIQRLPGWLSKAAFSGPDQITH